MEVGQGPQVVPDAERLPQLLYHLTAGRYRELVERRGSPFEVPEDPDAYLVRRGALLVERVAACSDGAVCLPDPATLEVGSELQLQTGDRPVKVSVRRFGPAPVPARTVPAGTTVRIWTWGPSVAEEPWMVTAPGGCLVPIPPR